MFPDVEGLGMVQVMVTLPERFLVLAPSVGAVNFTTVDDVVRHINYLVEQARISTIIFDASAYFLSRGRLRNSNQTLSPSRDLRKTIALIAHT
jgi:hypothetical protein